MRIKFGKEDPNGDLINLDIIIETRKHRWSSSEYSISWYAILGFSSVVTITMLYISVIGLCAIFG